MGPVKGMLFLDTALEGERIVVVDSMVKYKMPSSSGCLKVEVCL